MHTDHPLVDAARRFVADCVAPRLDAGDPPWLDGALARSAAGFGLLGITVPAAFGGADAGFMAKARVSEELSRADFGLAMALINSHNVADNLARNADPEVARRYVSEIVAGRLAACTALTEPGAGSDFASITTTARQDGGEWVLDGTKAWIINATRSGVVILYAQTQPGSGAAGIASFVVDASRAGFVREAPLTRALPALGTGAFRLVGYRASANEMLVPPGQAFKRALTSINGARIYVAAMCCGMVGAALDVAIAYGGARHSFGKPLLAHQAWRHALADAAVELEAARLLVYDAARRLENGEDVQGGAARAKVFATGMAQRQLTALLHAMGAAGLSDRHPFLRHLESAQAAAFTDGSTEMLKERIAREFGSQA
ncbi:MAG: acyl-CoA dehydrogenase family protein [Burkholderiales bacterium]|nr:acyl-CoA dehydrogenase family protein [Burkholderiales bacterium]